MPKNKVERTLTTVAGVAAESAATLVPVPGVGAVTSAFAETLIGRVFLRAQQEKVRRWFSDVAAASRFGSPDALASEIEAHIDDDWAQEAVGQGFWLSMQALNLAVLPALAALSASYIDEERPPDQLFRRTGRLLTELDPAEIQQLQVILEALFKVAIEDGSTTMAIAESEGGWGTLYCTWVPDPCASDLDERRLNSEVGPECARVFAALKSTRFAFEAVTGGLGKRDSESLRILFTPRHTDELADVLKFARLVETNGTTK